jgi:REP element-mobilizing transposase RayT
MSRPLRRRTIRLADHQYMVGHHLLTVCTHERRQTLGEIPVDVLLPSALGSVAGDAWRLTVADMPTVDCDAFVVMPNHVHAVVEMSAAADVRYGGGGVGSLVAQFKQRTRKMAPPSEVPIWQRGYHERVLPNTTAVLAAIAYVENNPAQWRRDPYRS